MAQSVHIRDTYLLVGPDRSAVSGLLYCTVYSRRRRHTATYVVPRTSTVLVRTGTRRVRLIQRTIVRYVRPCRAAPGRGADGWHDRHTKTRCRWRLQRTSVHLHDRQTSTKAFPGTPARPPVRPAVYLMSCLLDRWTTITHAADRVPGDRAEQLDSRQCRSAVGPSVCLSATQAVTYSRPQA